MIFTLFANMATQASGDAIPFIEDGLQIYIDAQFTSSYPGTGATWFDMTSNGNDLTLVNTPTYDSADGGSIEFVGTSAQYGDFGTKSIITNDYSFQMWIKPRATNYSGKHHYMFAMGYNASESNLFMRDTYGGNRYQSIVVNGGTLVDNIAVTDPAADTWALLTVTKDTSGNYTMYINNSSVATWTRLSNVASGKYMIGYAEPRFGTPYSYFDYLNANLGNFALYNKELTSGEVTSNYNATKTRFGL